MGQGHSSCCTSTLRVMLKPAQCLTDPQLLLVELKQPRITISKHNAVYGPLSSFRFIHTHCPLGRNEFWLQSFDCSRVTHLHQKLGSLLVLIVSLTVL